jgi:hypothetical protein
MNQTTTVIDQPMARARDVALLLGITEKTATRRLRAGDIQGARKIGRLWFVPRPVLEAMAAGTVPCHPETTNPAG